MNAPHPAETCEDRDYHCCDLMPPVPPCGEMTPDEYGAWYDSHVAAWEAAQFDGTGAP